MVLSRSETRDVSRLCEGARRTDGAAAASERARAGPPPPPPPSLPPPTDSSAVLHSVHLTRPTDDVATVLPRVTLHTLSLPASFAVPKLQYNYDICLHSIEKNNLTDLCINKRTTFLKYIVTTLEFSWYYIFTIAIKNINHH